MEIVRCYLLSYSANEHIIYAVSLEEGQVLKWLRNCERRRMIGHEAKMLSNTEKYVTKTSVDIVMQSDGAHCPPSSADIKNDPSPPPYVVLVCN
jgi:hypothetical protein